MDNPNYKHYNFYVPNIDLLYFVRFIIKDCLIKRDYNLVEKALYLENIQNICSKLNKRAVKVIKNNLINKHKTNKVRISSTVTNRRVYTKGVLGNQHLRTDTLFTNELLDLLDVNLLSTEKKTLLLKTLELNKRLKIIRKTYESELFENYTFVKTLGQGSYGKVFLVCSKKNKTPFALKVIKSFLFEEKKKFFEYKIDFEYGLKNIGTVVDAKKLENKNQTDTAGMCYEIKDEQPGKHRGGIRLYVLREIYMMLLIKYLSERWFQRINPDNTLDVRNDNGFIKPIRILWSPNFIYMIMPAYRCNLREYVNLYFKSGANVKLIKSVMKRLIRILYMLHHEFRIVHRDVKPDNVLVSHNSLVDVNHTASNSVNIQGPEIKDLVLADFGLSRVLNSPHTTKNLTINVVTLNYKAPELLLNYKYYDFSVDIWCLGCILYELITGRQLFNEHNEFNLLLKIFKRIRCPLKQEWGNLSSIPYLNLGLSGQESIFKSLSNSCDKNLVNLLSRFDIIHYLRLLEVNHNKRITAREALKHAFLI